MATQEEKENVKRLEALLKQYRQKFVDEAGCRLDPDRQIAFTIGIMKSDWRILRCDPGTVVAAALSATRMGLSLNPIQEYVSITSRRRRDGRYEAEAMSGYKGLMHLMREYGRVKRIFARAVFEGELFEVDNYHEDIKHITTMDAQRGPMKAAYAVAIWPDGDRQFEVLSERDDIRPIRDEALSRVQEKDRADAPWAKWYRPMAMKTAVRALFKWIDVPEMVAAVLHAEDEAERPPTRLDFDPETGEVLGERAQDAPGAPGNPPPSAGDNQPPASPETPHTGPQETRAPDPGPAKDGGQAVAQDAPGAPGNPPPSAGDNQPPASPETPHTGPQETKGRSRRREKPAPADPMLEQWKKDALAAGY